MATDEFEEESRGISVSVRIRPLNQRELKENQTIGWEFNDTALIEESAHGTKTYTFDHVFAPQTTTNSLVYECVAKQVVMKAMMGYNGTVFTYGQTGSGKTWSIMGSKEDPGITIRCIADIFTHIRANPSVEYSLKVSYLEVYNEEINDLLQSGDEGRNLRIVSDDPIKGPVIGGLLEEDVTSEDDILSVIQRGEQNRSYGSTQMNDNSSRSHTLYRLIIESKEEVEVGLGDEGGSGFKSLGASGGAASTKSVVKLSYLNLVDLAGSERQKSTGAKGKQLKEGANINKSLLALGSVIQKLVEQGKQMEKGGGSASRKSGFIPYRDSKLTRILKQSLGGNALTSILCTITAAPMHHEETTSTLKFGQLCKTIKNKPKSNASVDDKVLLRQYRDRLVALREEGEAKDAQIKVETQKVAELTARLAEAEAEAVKIAEATKVDDATAALLEQTRLAAAREKTRADDLESKISSLRQEARIEAEAELEKKLQAEKRKFQRELQVIQEQTARAEELDERESDLEEDKHRLKEKEKEIDSRIKVQQEEQAELARLFVKLDERESDLLQQIHTLKKQFNEWSEIRASLGETEKRLTEWQGQAEKRQQAQDERQRALDAMETRLSELDKNIEARNQDCKQRESKCDKQQASLDNEKTNLDARAADIAKRETQTNNWNGLLMTREQEVETHEVDLKKREEQLDTSQKACKDLEESLQAQKTEAEERSRALQEREKRAEATIQHADKIKRDYDRRLRNLEGRERKLYDTEKQSKELEKDLESRETTLSERVTEIEQREHAVQEREDHVEEMAKRYSEVVVREAALSVRIDKQQKLEEDFYRIEAQIINNKNARELREMETKLQEESELVQTLEKDKERLIHEKHTRDDRVAELELELDRVRYDQSKRADPMSLVQGTSLPVALSDGNELAGPAMRSELVRRLSQTETFLRYTLLLHGRQPAKAGGALHMSVPASVAEEDMPESLTPQGLERQAERDLLLIRRSILAEGNTSPLGTGHDQPRTEARSHIIGSLHRTRELLDNLEAAIESTVISPDGLVNVDDVQTQVVARLVHERQLNAEMWRLKQQEQQLLQQQRQQQYRQGRGQDTEASMYSRDEDARRQRHSSPDRNRSRPSSQTGYSGQEPKAGPSHERRRNVKSSGLRDDPHGRRTGAGVRRSSPERPMRPQRSAQERHRAGVSGSGKAPLHMRVENSALAPAPSVSHAAKQKPAPGATTVSVTLTKPPKGRAGATVKGERALSSRHPTSMATSARAHASVTGTSGRLRLLSGDSAGSIPRDLLDQELEG